MMTSRLTLLTILLFTFNVNAQDLDTVTIAGRVMDQNGAVVPGAEVHPEGSEEAVQVRAVPDEEP